MVVREHVALSELTTLKVGGLARFVCTGESLEDVEKAVALAQTQNLPFTVLGEGSNVLARDQNYEGVVLLMHMQGTSYTDEGDQVLVTAGAGVSWDGLVSEAVERELWGLENLAGIPGTVGAAPVQNIGAYGAELQTLFVSANVFDAHTKTWSSFDRNDCQFAYRDSIFKRNRSLVIEEVTLKLSNVGAPQLGYSDLRTLVQEGKTLDTPCTIVENVRQVRSHKFPDLVQHGTAGSFFKNPIIEPELFASLCSQYGAMPSYPAVGGIKIPLAFILDHILGLRGHREGKVSLFGNQPLVLVADRGATAADIDAFANAIAKKVFEATGIVIEREVQTM